MIRMFFYLLAAALLLPMTAVHAGGGQWQLNPDRNSSTAMAEELMAVVNAMRSERGLAQISLHPILMQVAQSHAEYMAATGQITHYSVDGKRPFQRALEAGFPVAGDLSLGGFYSENIVAGGNMTPQEAVEIWLGDDPHRNTMFSEYRSHLGAGVAIAGGVVYYVLDTALYSNVPVSQTVVVQEAPTEGLLLAPIARNTPAGDGSINHTVQVGETLWAIAAIYNLTVDQLVALNQLTTDQLIFPDDQLIIQPSFTPTVTFTPTLGPTSTVRATKPPQASSTPPAVLPTATEMEIDSTADPSDGDLLNILVPAGIALSFILLVVILWHGFRRGASE